MTQQKRDMHERIVFIDILKSIACLCVLIGHVINGMLKDGMEVAMLLRIVNSYVYMFHVPCFFFASGYLYANKPVVTWSGYPRFVGKKLIVLGLPYIVCSIAYILFSSVLSSDMHTSYSIDAILSLGTTPVAQYWYLYALFEMFLIIPAVELLFHGLDRKWILLLLVVCALIVQDDLGSIGYVVAYGCFFYMGAYFNSAGVMNGRCFAKEPFSRILVISCAGSIIVYAGYQFVAAKKILLPEVNYGLKGIVKILLVLSIVGISWAVAGKPSMVSRFLIWLSQYSLYIYLFHTWFTGTLRILLRKSGVMNSWIQTICGIAVGLAGSFVTTIVIRKVSFLRFWFEPFHKTKG